MTNDELRNLGQQIARDVAEGLMAATAAGAAQFCREMGDAARAAEADGLLELAERIEQEKKDLAGQIASSTGLKKLALERRLSQLEQAEARLCEQTSGQAPALIEHEPGKPAPTHKRDGRRFVPVANGH